MPGAAPLAGKVAIVTGGGGGLGLAVSQMLAAEGAVVALTDLASAEPEAVARRLPGAPDRVSGQVLDVRDPRAVEGFVARLEERHETVDILVCASGIPGRGQIDTIDDDRWESIIAVNLSGVFYACRAVVPGMRRKGGGSIVVLASAAGLRGWPGSLAYSASKSGVVGLVRTLAQDLAHDDVRAWAVCPTAVDTPMFPRTFDGSDDPTGDRERFIAAQPMGRLIAPDEVVAAVRWLVVDRPPHTHDPLVV
jgi:NAD(P)-dependent dehydrogenase (short-subunit alcohol dehydrogenase family)